MISRVSIVQQNINYAKYQKSARSCSYSNNYAQPQSFNGLPASHRFSPLNYYFNKQMQRSLDASSKYILDVIPELEGKVEAVVLRTKDKKKLNCWDINPSNSKKYILFLHGMSENITYSQKLYSEINNQGYGVFALEYRGFGINAKARFNEQNLNKDVDAAFKYLGTKTDISSIGIVAHSAGCAMAVTAGRKNKNLAQVILVSPVNGLKNVFSSILSSKKGGIPKPFANFIKKHPILVAPFNRVMRTSDKISKVNAPLSFIHSENDPLIPISNSILLSEKAKNPVNLIKLTSGGHRLDDEKIKSIIDILNKSTPN